MMKLSDNLSLNEVIKSDTAIKNGISNLPTKQHLESLKLIATKIFQPIRDHFGSAIYVSSGYRSNELNEAIGGSKTSDHCYGRALDIDQDHRNSPVSNAEIFDFIHDELDFDQLIWEFGDDENPSWVHVGYRSKRDNRNEVLKVERIDGKSVYTNYI